METQRRPNPTRGQFYSEVTKKKKRLLGADEIGNTSNILNLNKRHLVSLDE